MNKKLLKEVNQTIKEIEEQLKERKQNAKTT